MSEQPTEAFDSELEERVDRALAETTLRRAPATLESRVLQELRRRAALPWWRRSFAAWPGTVRVAFAVSCSALVAATVLVAARANMEVGSLHLSAALSGRWTQAIWGLFGVARELTGPIAAAVPPAWIYAGLAASAALYAALFGLAVAAYRTLYLKIENAGELEP